MNKYWNCFGGKGVVFFMFNFINGLDIYVFIKLIGVCFFLVFNIDLGDRDWIYLRFFDIGVYCDK